MSVYNNAPHLAPAIASIVAQSVSDFEFLIVNDGSTDGSAAIIDRFAASDSRIIPIHQPNRGLVASLNHMLAIASGSLIARMDGDDIALPERFARQIAFLDANPAFGVVGTWTNSIDDAGNSRPDLDGHPTTHEGFLAAMEHGPLLCHPSVMMRRDIVRDAGGYHAAFSHCEDYDLWLRLSERTRLCSIPERLLLYRHSEGQVSSRHAVAQQTGAAVSWLAHGERMAGRPDPSLGWAALPALSQLDAAFGRAGIATMVRARVAPGILYARSALRGDGFALILDHLREGGAHAGMWRAAARLLTLGEPARALALVMALIRNRPR
jgi:hypothetical protein